MARERTPEGKRVVIPVRVSEPKAAAIDKARGETARSVWVEAAIDERLERLDQAEYERQMAAASGGNRAAPLLPSLLNARIASLPVRCKTCKTAKPEGGKR